MLVNPGTKLIEVIKEVRDITGLGLRAAKDLVEASEKTPQSVKQGVKKSEADKIKRKLEGAGAKVEVQEMPTLTVDKAVIEFMTDKLIGHLYDGRPESRFEVLQACAGAVGFTIGNFYCGDCAQMVRDQFLERLDSAAKLAAEIAAETSAEEEEEQTTVIH
jgi:ribosomal protein L7/L12